MGRICPKKGSYTVLALENLASMDDLAKRTGILLDTVLLIQTVRNSFLSEEQGKHSPTIASCQVKISANQDKIRIPNITI